MKKRSSFAINERDSKLFIKGNVKLNSKEDSSKTNKFGGIISALVMIAVIGAGIILVIDKNHTKESYATKENYSMNELNYEKIDSKKEVEKRADVEQIAKDWLVRIPVLSGQLFWNYLDTDSGFN